MNQEQKTKLLGLVCAGMDGRNPRDYILAMDGLDCVQAHNVLKGLDDLLKAQWKLHGSPSPDDVEIL